MLVRIGFFAAAICLASPAFAEGWLPSWGRSAQEDIFYDRCLIATAGNTVACDARIRENRRDKEAAEKRRQEDCVGLLRSFEPAYREEAVKLLRAGFPQSEITAYATEQGKLAVGYPVDAKICAEWAR